jgi:hypothetical protein
MASSELPDEVLVVAAIVGDVEAFDQAEEPETLATVRCTIYRQ